MGSVSSRALYSGASRECLARECRVQMGHDSFEEIEVKVYFRKWNFIFFKIDAGFLQPTFFM